MIVFMNHGFIVRSSEDDLPPEGSYRAVIADVVDHDDWKPMVSIVYLLEATNGGGFHFIISQAFDKGLAHTSRLRQFLDTLEVGEIEGPVNLERLLVGLQRSLTIAHANEGGTIVAVPTFPS